MATKRLYIDLPLREWKWIVRTLKRFGHSEEDTHLTMAWIRHGLVMAKLYELE